jgi:16S rRNA G966 N2-methylase RsmD
MNIRKFIHSYERDQLIGFVNTLFGKFGIKFRFKNAIQKRILYLTKKLKLLSKNLVQSGAYKNMKIGDIAWSEYDYCPKIIGVYENEVQNELLKTNCKYIVNLGAGEGYHAIGQILSGTKEQAICFELSKTSRKFLNTNSKINNIENKIKIFEKANNNYLDYLQEKISDIDFKECVFLIDIEGEEFNIINNKNLETLKESKLIIEFHEKDKSLNEENLRFIEMLKQFYDLNFLTTRERDFSKIDFLKDFIDIDRWLMASENRIGLMKWIVCVPKKEKNSNE